MGYTIVIELQDIEHDETTHIHFGHFETFKDMTTTLQQVQAEVKSCGEDEESNRLVQVGWRALRDVRLDDIQREVTRFINKGRRKRQ